MNRKIKTYVTTGMIAAFFLTAGGWYFFSSNGFKVKEGNDTELTSISTSMEEAKLSEELQEEHASENTENGEVIVVYVCGAVKSPGIYTLSAGSRLHEAVALAGGFSTDADPAYHNLARYVVDGERIYILSFAETEALSAELKVTGEAGAAEERKQSGLININSATEKQLMELPGIGEAKAGSIIEYRSKVGQFTAIEELMNVSGIGEAMFEKIKDKITVK